MAEIISFAQLALILMIAGAVIIIANCLAIILIMAMLGGNPITKQREREDRERKEKRTDEH